MHTPGPWYIAGHLVVHYESDGKAPTVAQVMDDDNARLIAAAPDLLEALEDLERKALRFGNNAQASRSGVYISAEEWERDFDALKAAQQTAYTAIAKARGE